jgi:peptide-methionine (S)-S-oxide reductase
MSVFRPQLRFERMKGVVRCVVGYSGGEEKRPTYRTIKDHTEALLLEFDPSMVRYGDLVVSWTQMHLPNYASKTQYRSAVWYMDGDQKEIAQEIIEEWEASSREMLYTSVEPALRFYRAEEYHQFFLQKRMSGGC